MNKKPSETKASHAVFITGIVCVIISIIFGNIAPMIFFIAMFVEYFYVYLMGNEAKQ